MKICTELCNNPRVLMVPKLIWLSLNFLMTPLMFLKSYLFFMRYQVTVMEFKVERKRMKLWSGKRKWLATVSCKFSTWNHYYKNMKIISGQTVEKKRKQMCIHLLGLWDRNLIRPRSLSSDKPLLGRYNKSTGFYSWLKFPYLKQF